MLLQVFANDQLNYSNVCTLSNTLTWTAQTHVSTLDYAVVTDITNTDIGWLTTTITPIVNNTPANINNYTINFVANNYQTTYFLANSVNPTMRTLVIQTKFTANSGLTMDANNIFLEILASTV